MNNVTCNRLFNIYGFTGGSFAGNVYDPQGIAFALRANGGGNSEPIIIEYMEDLFKEFSTKDLTEADFEVIEESGEEEEQYPSIFSLPPELQGKKFRIRKLTPRECFRLMGVDDKDIDKIQAAGVSNSGQYKLAGNSIVVDVLFHLFRKMFIDTEPDFQEGHQLALF